MNIVNENEEIWVRNLFKNSRSKAEIIFLKIPEAMKNNKNIT